MTRLLVVRDFKRPTGGNVTVRDFCFHALAHPRLDTRVYFTPGSRHAESGLWARLPPERVVARPDFTAADLVLDNGKDWRLLPATGRFGVIHLVQHLGYPDDPELAGYLARQASRVCVSPEVAESIAGLARGPVVVIPNALDPTLFHEDGSRRPGSVLIAGAKRPGLAAEIAAGLAAAGVSADLCCGWLPQGEFARRTRAADVFVALPGRAEGFFRPPLEALASGCAVVCADARGNRGHCRPDETCAQPPWDDAPAHVEAVLGLLRDAPRRERLRAGGRALAQGFGLAQQRARFHALIDELLAQA